MANSSEPEYQPGNIENKVTRLKEMQKCMRALNKLSTGETDPHKYAGSVCGILSSPGIYAAAWIILYNESDLIDQFFSAGSVGGGSGRKAAYDALIKTECLRLGIEGEHAETVSPPEEKCRDCPAVITKRLSYENRFFGVFAAALPAPLIDDEDEVQLFNDAADDLSLAFYRIYTDRREQWIRYTLRKMPNTFSYISRELRYIVVNESYARLFGTTAEDMIGRAVSEFFNEDQYRKRILPILERCLAGENQEDIQSLQSEDKQLLILRKFYYPYIDSDGTVQGILSHGIEVQEKNVTEQKLFEFFMRIANEAQYGIILADVTGQILYINKYFADICGYPPDDLMGKNVSILYSDDYDVQAGTLRAELDEKGFFSARELSYKRKDGTTALLLVNGMMIRDDFNKPVRMMAMAQDLTYVRKTENELSISEVRFRQLIDTASDIIIVLTEDGIITEINNTACEALGYGMAELVGKPIALFDYPSEEAERTVDGFHAFWKDVPHNEKTVFESRHRRKDGSVYPVEISGRKILLDGEIFIICIARDITEQNVIKEQMSEAVKKAEESDRMKSAFLANMSHEIRTPLNGILGFSALMNDPGNTPEKQQKYYEIIQLSGQRLLSTINDLIDISRIETGAIEIDITPVEINVLLDELYSFFSPDIRGKQLEFNLFKDTEKDLYIRTDYDKLYAILSNLLRNALKFTNSGSISIGYSLTDKEIRFRVSDTGIGIGHDKLESIFDRFVQADQSLTKPYEGFGLGLSICREYTEMLNGKISVESEEGSGTEFTVTIPRESV